MPRIAQLLLARCLSQVSYHGVQSATCGVFVGVGSQFKNLAVFRLFFSVKDQAERRQHVGLNKSTPTGIISQRELAGRELEGHCGHHRVIGELSPFVLRKLAIGLLAVCPNALLSKQPDVSGFSAGRVVPC